MSHAPRIEETVKAMSAQVFSDNLRGRELAMVVEANQKYVDYLDDLFTAKLEVPAECVTVQVNGTTIKFENADKFADWLAENIT